MVSRCNRALLLASLVSIASGCGPSVASLVRDRHYREAVCAVAGGDEAEVMDALVRDAEVRVRAHRLGEGELAAIDPRAGEAIAPRAAIVVVALESRRVPVDSLSAEVVLLDGGEPASAPATRSTLIWATGETEPPPVAMETGVTPANTLLALGYVLTGGIPLLFGGLASAASGRPFDPFPDRAIVSVDAPEREYERLAPVATSLRRALPVCVSAMGPMLRCEGTLLVDPRVARGALRVTVRATARRVSRRGTPLDDTCVATRDYPIAWDHVGTDLEVGVLGAPEARSLPRRE